MLIVSPLNKTEQLVRERNITHVIGLLGPESTHPELVLIRPQNRLKLSFNDITVPAEGMICPAEKDVRDLVGFVDAAGTEANILIHCWAGVSRSTAAAYTAKCVLEPQASEFDLAREMRLLSASATPNRLLVAFADKILGRNGRMSAAIDHIGRGEFCFEGNVFEWE